MDFSGQRLKQSSDGLDIDFIDRKLDGAYTEMLRVVKNVTWRQSIANEVFYAGLDLARISTTIRERRLRFSGDYWKGRNEVVSDLVLWLSKHGTRSVGRQARTFVYLLEADTGVSKDCLPAGFKDENISAVPPSSYKIPSVGKKISAEKRQRKKKKKIMERF